MTYWLPDGRRLVLLAASPAEWAETARAQLLRVGCSEEYAAPVRGARRRRHEGGAGMNMFAVTLRENENAWRDESAWMEFYWADDEGYAEEQARNAHEGCWVVCICQVPLEWAKVPE
jgi:hypothetical protein